MSLTNFIISILAVSFLFSACGDKDEDAPSVSDMGLHVQQLDFDTMEIEADPDMLGLDLDLD